MKPSCCCQYHRPRLARYSFVAYGELHALCAGCTQLAANHDLATLGAALHDEAEHTVAGTANSQTVEELVAKRFALGDGGETTVLDLGGVEGDGVFGEL